MKTVLIISAIVGFVIGCVWGIIKDIKESRNIDVRYVSYIFYSPEEKLLSFIGGDGKTSYEFNGISTVWFWPSGKRCDVSTEVKLSEIYHKWLLENKK